MNNCFGPGVSRLARCSASEDGGPSVCHALCQNDFQTRWRDGDVMVENAHTSAVSSVNWTGHLNWLTPFYLPVNFKLCTKNNEN